MRNCKGQFVKGVRSSMGTEFKKGQHWRKRKPFWDYEWLFTEYIVKHRSSEDIGNQFGVGATAILFWLKKHKIAARNTSEVRAIKHWGECGEKNPMYGKRGILNPRWEGGFTPARQNIYAKSEWRQLARAVYARDRKCKMCGSKEKLEVHHIEPFSQCPLLVMDIGNVILLCHKCHNRLRGKEKRWRKKLIKLIQESQ